MVSSSGDAITGLPVLTTDHTKSVKVFLAGAAIDPNDAQSVLTAGGRVLCVTALADTILSAQQKALAVTAAISFDGAHYRRDIGHHAITREHNQ